MNKTLLTCLFFILALTSGCGPSSSQTHSNEDSNRSKVYTEAELSKLIDTGMSVASLTNIFGIPDSDIHVTENTRVLRYSFPFDFTKEGLYVSGFTVQIKNDSVVRWSSVKAVAPKEMFQGQEETQPEVSYGELTFELFTLTESMTNTLQAIELEGSADASTIGTAPSLVFKAEVFAGTTDSNPTNKSIRLIVVDQDVPKLSNFTKENFGKRILIAAQNKVIAAPVITVPITSRQFRFMASDTSFLKSAKSN